MKPTVRPVLFLSGLAFLLGTLCMTSCTVKSGAHITKVNPYHLQPGVAPQTEEKMIDFEYRRKIYGAVTSKDYRDRYGNYYTIYWSADNQDQPVTVRLQYRQAVTGPKIFVVEKVVDIPHRTNSTNFEIIGDDYSDRGAVTQWKASIVQDGAVVDEFKSFLWQ